MNNFITLSEMRLDYSLAAERNDRLVRPGAIVEGAQALVFMLGDTLQQ